jgi:hypothetical protein
MSTRRNMLILAAGTALVFAAPAAIAETQSSEAPDGVEPAGTAVDAPAVPTAGTAEPTTPPAPAAAPEPEPTTVPEAEPAPQPETAPTPEPAPQPEAGPAPDSAPPADAGPKADPAPQPGSGSKPASAPRRRTGPANESAPADSTDSAPRAAQQVPAEPAPAPGSAQGCVITSAGLVCPGDPDCVITSSGVTCASNCTITSAGLSCPSGGEVLPNAPVSGGPQRGPRRRPAPDVGVKPEREAQAEGDVSPTTIVPVEETTATDDALPFTGAPLLAWLVIGFALWAGGLLLRRKTSTRRTAVELSSDAEQLALPATPPARAGKPGSRWALVLQTLALLAIGMLMSRRTRR